MNKKDVPYLILNKYEMCIFNISRKFEVNLLYMAISRLQEAIKFQPKHTINHKKLGEKIKDQTNKQRASKALSDICTSKILCLNK